MAEGDDVVTKLPSERILRSLARLSEETRGKTSQASGEFGQAIKDAADKHNLHPAAFKLLARLKRMDALKLALFLDHFDDYRAKFKLDDLAAKAIPGLIDGDEEADKPPQRKKPMFDDGKVVSMKEKAAESA